MSIWQRLMAVTAATAFLAACTTDPYTGEQKAGKAGVYGGVGAATGAVIGAATASKKDRGKGALIGAVVGGAAGGGYGYYVDQQEAKLRQTLQGTGVQVQRYGDDLKLIMPGHITFASNSADISSNFYPTLNSLVLVFEEFNKNGIDIVGHTDNTGSAMLNQRLSEQRAHSVANYLTANGIIGQRITVYGAGFSQPIASNDTEAGRAQNRRVEINLRPQQ